MSALMPLLLRPTMANGGRSYTIITALRSIDGFSSRKRISEFTSPVPMS